MNFSRVSRTSILAILLILFSGLGNAGQLDDASTAYAKGDYAQAFKLTQPIAMQGHAGAQYFLGLIYFNGEGGTTRL
ncbi:MAG: hypothetical protein Q7T85_14025 [Nitrosomonas sp.]|nr:hypothetical protein [Nitrosomonas sp.]